MVNTSDLLLLGGALLLLTNTGKSLLGSLVKGQLPAALGGEMPPDSFSITGVTLPNQQSDNLPVTVHINHTGPSNKPFRFVVLLEPQGGGTIYSGRYSGSESFVFQNDVQPKAYSPTVIVQKTPIGSGRGQFNCKVGIQDPGLLGPLAGTDLAFAQFMVNI